MPIFSDQEEEKTPVTGTERAVREEGQEMNSGEEPGSEGTEASTHY